MSRNKRSDTCIPEDNPYYMPILCERWVNDNHRTHCFECDKMFTRFKRRKHHCRMCGDIFCGECANHWVEGLIGYKGSQRVCSACLGKYDEVVSSRRSVQQASKLLKAKPDDDEDNTQQNSTGTSQQGSAPSTQINAQRTLEVPQYEFAGSYSDALQMLDGAPSSVDEASSSNNLVPVPATATTAPPQPSASNSNEQPADLEAVAQLLLAGIEGKPSSSATPEPPAAHHPDAGHPPLAYRQQRVSNLTAGPTSTASLFCAASGPRPAGSTGVLSAGGATATYYSANSTPSQHYLSLGTMGSQRLAGTSSAFGGSQSYMLPGSSRPSSSARLEADGTQQFSVSPTRGSRGQFYQSREGLPPVSPPLAPVPTPGSVPHSVVRRGGGSAPQPVPKQHVDAPIPIQNHSNENMSVTLSEHTTGYHFSVATDPSSFATTEDAFSAPRFREKEHPSGGPPSENAAPPPPLYLASPNESRSGSKRNIEDYIDSKSAQSSHLTRQGTDSLLGRQGTESYMSTRDPNAPTEPPSQNARPTKAVAGTSEHMRQETALLDPTGGLLLAAALEAYNNTLSQGGDRASSQGSVQPEAAVGLADEARLNKLLAERFLMYNDLLIESADEYYHLVAYRDAILWMSASEFSHLTPCYTAAEMARATGTEISVTQSTDANSHQPPVPTKGTNSDEPALQTSTAVSSTNQPVTASKDSATTSISEPTGEQTSSVTSQTPSTAVAAHHSTLEEKPRSRSPSQQKQQKSVRCCGKDFRCTGHLTKHFKIVEARKQGVSPPVSPTSTSAPSSFNSKLSHPAYPVRLVYEAQGTSRQGDTFLVAECNTLEEVDEEVSNLFAKEQMMVFQLGNGNPSPFEGSPNNVSPRISPMGSPALSFSGGLNTLLEDVEVLPSPTGEHAETAFGQRSGAEREIIRNLVILQDDDEREVVSDKGTSYQVYMSKAAGKGGLRRQHSRRKRSDSMSTSLSTSMTSLGMYGSGRNLTITSFDSPPSSFNEKRFMSSGGATSGGGGGGSFVQHHQQYGNTEDSSTPPTPSLQRQGSSTVMTHNPYPPHLIQRSASVSPTMSAMGTH